MAFHRKNNPTYFLIGGGSFPAGYDKINDPAHASVGGAGAPANADGKKSGGPNDGTWFVSFGEDGTSSHFNRPASALADNTDAIDDILNTSLPKISFTDHTAAGTVTSQALAPTGGVFVGKNAAPNTQAQRDRLIRVTDQNNNDLEFGAVKVVATAIHDGSSVNVVGTEATGFRSAGATITFSPGIPNGTTYRVWFGVRSSYQNISNTEKGTLFEETLRNIGNVPGEVRALFRLIHSEPSAAQAWDAAFDSTIRSLAAAGLNERYRKSTTQPAGFVTGDFNVAGSGRSITRDGPAVEIVSPDSAALAYPDPQMAQLRVRSANPAAGIGVNPGKGGDVGVFQEVDWSTSLDNSNERIRSALAGPAVLSAMFKDIRATTLSGQAAATFINDQANATLNPDSVNSPDARRTIQCAVGQFFQAAGPRTAIRVGVDMIEVRYQTGGTPTQTFLITGILSATRILVSPLAGWEPTVSVDIFPATAVTDVRIRWISVTASFGGSPHRFSSSPSPGYSLAVFGPAVSTANTSVGDPQTSSAAAYFGSAVRDSSAQLARRTAVAWGSAADDTGIVGILGRLLGDGGISCTDISALSGRQRLNKIGGSVATVTVSGSGTTSVNFNTDPSGARHYIINSLSTGTRTFSLTLPTGANLVEGDRLQFLLDASLVSASGIVNVTLVGANGGASPCVFAREPAPGGSDGSQFSIASGNVTLSIRGSSHSNDGSWMALELTAFSTGGTFAWFVKVFRLHGPLAF